MANFTKLNDQNVVLEVHSVRDDVATDEQAGITFLTNLHNYSNWKQTYKDGTRKNYAGNGYTYDADKDAFISEKPFSSWVLDENTCRWINPLASEEERNWVLKER